MNKLGVVLGVAAVATFSGCLDPNYSDRLDQARNGGVKTVPQSIEVSDTQPGEKVKVVAVDTTPIEVVDEPVTDATVKPVAPVKADTKATAKADANAQVKGDEKAPVSDVAAAPAEEETTIYIVQRNDYLAKISKKYNVKIDAIKKLNPQIKDNVILVGQKIKLPGKIDVGEQTAPVVAAKAAQTKEYKPYTGATKEYVVKSGDTLGGIAYGNGINIRQLKELNGLGSNLIRVGQKLKVPATKVVSPVVEKTVAAAQQASVVKTPAVVTVKEPVVADSVSAPIVATAADAVAPESQTVSVASSSVDEVAAAVSAVTADDGPTHVVQEGEDLLGLSLLFSLDPAEIRSLNNLGENDTLKPGQVIKLPADVNL